MAEVLEIIQRISYEVDSDQLSKQQKALGDSAAVTDKLKKEILATAAAQELITDPKKVQQLNKSLNELQGQYSKIKGETIETSKALDNLFSGANADQLKNLFSGDELSKLDEAIMSSANEMQQLATVTEALKGKLSTLDAGTEEFAELNAIVGVAEATLLEFADAEELVTGKAKPVKTQLRELRDAMNDMELAGQANTDEFRELANQAGVLQDQIDATTQRVKILSSDTKNIDFGIEAIQSVTGAFEVGAGAAALFGVAEEDLQKVQTKLIALMAIANGLQQLQNALQAEGTLRVVGHELATKALAAVQTAYNVVVGTSTGLLKGFRLALAATGIGAVIVALGYLVANWDELSDAIKGSTEEQRKYNELHDEAITNTAQEVAQLEILRQTAEDVTLSQKQRNAAVDQLQATYPEYLGNLDREKIKNGQVAGSYDLVSQSIINKAIAEAAAVRVAEYQTKINDLIIEKNKLIENQNKNKARAASAANVGAEREFALLDQRSKNLQKNVQGEIDLLKEERDLYVDLAKAGVEIKTPDVKKAVEKSTKKDPFVLKVNLESDNPAADAQRIADQIAAQKQAIQERLVKIFGDPKLTERIIEIKPELNDAAAKKLADDLYKAIENKGILDAAFSPEFIEELKAEAGEGGTAIAEGLGTFVEQLEPFVNAANGIFNSLANNAARQVERVEDKITRATTELQRAEEIADRGNAELYQEQIDRLAQLEAEKEEARQKELEYAQIQTIATQGLAFATSLLAIANAGSTGDPYTAAARIAAVVAALGAGLAFAQSFKSPQLAEGIDRFDARGGNDRISYSGGGRDKYPAWLDDGESVIQSDMAEKYRPAIKAMRRNKMPAWINDLALGKSLPLINNKAIQEAIISVHVQPSNDLKEMREDMKSMMIMFGNIQLQSTKLDPNGLITIQNKLLRETVRKNSYRG